MATIPQLQNTKPLPRAKRNAQAASHLELPKREALIDLMQKYDVQAPRYTSYPPATKFTPDYDGRDYLEHIVHVTAHGERPEISIYVHIPFCDTLCYFCGCTMMVMNNREKIAEYLTHLKREIELMKEYLDFEPTVVQMHWGGGSPTHLLPKEIEDLGLFIRSVFNFADDAVISIEIDPRGLTTEHVDAMQRVGFNRASIGVQDFDEVVQTAINRVQPRGMTEQVIDWCRKAGMTSINLDLIYGLPYQTTESFFATLDTVLKLSPDRIAVYNFAYVPWLKPHQKLISIETLPAPSNKLALLELAVRTLTDAGYIHLGMDHFAKSCDQLAIAQHEGTLHRNFQGYSTLAGKDLYSFGLSAIGRVENAYGQNVKDIDRYYQAIDAGELPIERGYLLTFDDEVREYVIMQLLCTCRLELEDVEKLFSIDFYSYFEDAISSLIELSGDDIVRISPQRIEVTELGRYFLRNVALAFDAYYKPGVTNKMFSRAI